MSTPHARATRRYLALALLPLVAGSTIGCKKPAAEKAPAAKPARPAPGAPAMPPPPKAVAVPATPASAGPPAARPLEHQLPHRMTELTFLGWSDDGKRFAMKTAYGYNMGELSTSDRLELFEIHDTLTGKLVASFRIARDNTTGKTDGLRSKAWKEAKPGAEWKAYRAAMKLEARRPALRAGGWVLGGEPARRMRRGKVTVTRGGNHLTTTWAGFPTKKLEEGLSSEEVLAAYGVKGKGEPGPSIRLFAAKKDRRLPLLTYQVPFGYREIIGCVDYTSAPGRAVGRVRGFWAPKSSTIGARVLLAIHARLDGMTDEEPTNQERYYVRTPGPQIKIVAEPSGEAAARSLSAKLAAAGLAVTQLSLEGKPRDRTLIYHRGDDGRALARRLAQVVNRPSETKALNSPGWLQLIVLLGGAAGK